MAYRFTNMLRLSVALVALAAALALAQPAQSIPSAMAAENCGANEACTTFDATKTTSRITKGTTTTTTTTSTSSSFTSRVKTYEITKKTKVVFYWAKEGLKITRSTKCTDPVKRGWIKVGQKFKNTYLDARGRKVVKITRWRKGDLLCNYRKVGSGKNARVRGTIKRCKNKDVEIFLEQKLKRKLDKVTEFKSKPDFEEKSGSSSSSTSSGGTVFTTCPAGYTDEGTTCVKVTYSCPAGSTMQPDGVTCKTCVTNPIACPPDRPPNGEIDAAALHVQTGGRTVKLYFVGDDPDGDSVVLDILLQAPSGTEVQGKTRVTMFSDPQRVCPSDKTCWEATLVSGNTTGNALISARFTAGGKSFTTEPVTVTVAPDQFPTSRKLGLAAMV